MVPVARHWISKYLFSNSRTAGVAGILLAHWRTRRQRNAPVNRLPWSPSTECSAFQRYACILLAHYPFVYSHTLPCMKPTRCLRSCSPALSPYGRWNPTPKSLPLKETCQGRNRAAPVDAADFAAWDIACAWEVMYIFIRKNTSMFRAMGLKRRRAERRPKDAFSSYRLLCARARGSVSPWSGTEAIHTSVLTQNETFPAMTRDPFRTSQFRRPVPTAPSKL